MRYGPGFLVDECLILKFKSLGRVLKVHVAEILSYLCNEVESRLQKLNLLTLA